jgi:predicted neutral ceramidase superfamily lipid hydrolase
MNQKAATDGVISKLVIQLNSDDHFVSVNAGNAIGNIVSSSAMVTQLSPKIVSDLCLAKGGSMYLKNASLDQLVNIFFITENASWLSAASQFSILVGAAVTVTGEKVVVYGRKEPVELSVPTLKLRKKLIKAFTDQSKRLHLAFESLPERQDICTRVLAFVIPRNFSANS